MKIIIFVVRKELVVLWMYFNKEKILIIVLLVIISSSAFYNLKYTENSNLLFKESLSRDENKTFDEITKLDLNINTFIDADKVWGQPTQITFAEINVDQYSVMQGYDGNFHCAWVRRLDRIGFALSYASTSNNDTMNWSTPIQILQMDAKIRTPKIIIDKTNTVHIAFITKREKFERVNYVYKTAIGSNWSNNEILDKSEQTEFSDLNFVLTNNYTLHLAWISNALVRNESTKESEIHFKTRNNLTKSWGNVKRIYSSINPLQMSINSLSNQSIVVTMTKWSADFVENEIYIAQSNDEGQNWGPSSLITSTGTLISDIQVIPSLISGGVHVIGILDDIAKQIHHLELYANWSIRTNLSLINNPIHDSDIAGLAEDTVTEDVYILYEDTYLENPNILYRKRSGIDLSWDLEIDITNDDSSYDPIFIYNTYNNESSFGELFYLNVEALQTQTFSNSFTWSEPATVVKTFKTNNQNSFAVESDGTIHFIWEHKGEIDNDIFYMKKNPIGEWIFQGSIMNVGKKTASSPQLTIDSNDNLHCTFIANTNATSYTSILYVTKNHNQNNWSVPVIIKNPVGNVLRNNYKMIIDEFYIIHIIWTEQTGSFQNNLVYSFKALIDDIFTSETILANIEYTACYEPDMIIDSNRDLHIVYREYYRPNLFSVLKYISKPYGQSWSSIESLVSTVEELLLRPLLTVDSENTIRLVYLRKYILSSFLVSDAEVWIKPQSESWSYDGTIITAEMINYHDFLITNDNKLIYLHHITDLPIDLFPDEIVDQVLIISSDGGNRWSNREVLFKNPHYTYEPSGLFHEATDNIYIAIYDSIYGKPQINFQFLQNDTDNDLLGDIDELVYRTDVNEPDSDQDLIDDGYEVTVTCSNPALNDTDWDKLEDGDEILNYKSNPLTYDSDKDLISDFDEIMIWDTDPNSIDSDSDGISDFDELFIFNTNPNREDTEHDGMPDLWEILNGLDPNLDDGFEDLDSDNLFNVEEYWYETDPHNPDSDFDDLLDGEEVKIWKTDPTKYDTDDDTIGDSDEVLIYHTNPLKDDTDEDGFTDREEINSGTDPNNPRDNVRTRLIRRILLSISIPILSLVAMFSVLEVRYQIRSKKLKANEKDELRIEEERYRLILDEEVGE